MCVIVIYVFIWVAKDILLGSIAVPYLEPLQSLDGVVRFLCTSPQEVGHCVCNLLRGVWVIAVPKCNHGGSPAVASHNIRVRKLCVPVEMKTGSQIAQGYRELRLEKVDNPLAVSKASNSKMVGRWLIVLADSDSENHL